MLQASRYAHRSALTTDFAGWLTDGAASLIARLDALQRRAHGRDKLSELSDEQLEDIGVDRSAIHGDRPIIEVKTGLMANLMSMR